jgi:II/X family phage/plasmid replication protein
LGAAPSSSPFQKGLSDTDGVIFWHGRKHGRGAARLMMGTRVIDWLTIYGIPCNHDAAKLYHGVRMEIDENGEIITSWEKPKPMKGSFEKQITVRTDPRSAPDQRGEGIRSMLEISGNPSKFFQGHNLFGSNDALGLAQAMIYAAIREFGLQPTQGQLQEIERGLFSFSRVDVTESWATRSRAEVRAAIRGMENCATLKNRGKGVFKGGTLYFAKNSRRWALKAYGKGDEIEVNSKKFGDHTIPAKHDHFDLLKAHADRLLRFELCLRGKEMKDSPLRLDMAKNWGTGTADKLYKSYFSKLEIAGNIVLPAEDIEELPNRLRIAYQLWVDGHDLRTQYKKATFYRYRRQLLNYGIDIANPLPISGDHSQNILNLKELLQSPPVPVPDWAHGTVSYFEPKVTLGADGAE